MRNLAIVRPPSESFRQCLSSHPMRHQVSVERARTQHKKYCKVLEELGLELIVLESEPFFPDCCFIEDTAIVRGNESFIARLGATRRRGEEAAVADVLRRYTTIRRAEAPATIEGGDVIHLPDFLLVGVGQRTNREGVRQLSDALEIPTKPVEDQRIFHLKSDVTYLGSDTLLTTARFAKHEALQGFTLLHVPPGEEYGANTLTVGDRVLMSSRQKKTLDVVKKAGFHPLPIDMSEFEKCDGAITCLSIVL